MSEDAEEIVDTIIDRYRRHATLRRTLSRPDSDNRASYDPTKSVTTVTIGADHSKLIKTAPTVSLGTGDLYPANSGQSPHTTVDLRTENQEGLVPGSDRVRMAGLRNSGPFYAMTNSEAEADALLEEEANKTKKC